MDPRIEMIDDHIVAVDFTQLPMEGINHIPDPTIPTEEDAGRISDEGIFVLNTKYNGYTLLKNAMMELVHLNNKKLLRRRNKLSKKGSSNVDKLNIEFIKIELERRQKKKVYDHESKY